MICKLNLHTKLHIYRTTRTMMININNNFLKKLLIKIIEVFRDRYKRCGESLDDDICQIYVYLWN